MNIYHCIILDFDFEIARFQLVKNKTLINVFVKMSSARTKAYQNSNPAH